MPAFADRVLDLTQSDIRAVSLHLRAAGGGINLGQGICDMPTPDAIKLGAQAAIANDRSIYTSYAGIAPLRDALAEKARAYNGLPVASRDDVVVSGGSTGAFVATIHTLLNPGDEVVLFEPFYGYHRNLLQLIGAVPTYVTTRGPDWAIDFDAVRAALTPRTKAVIVCTPNNPSGKVWTRAELHELLTLAEAHDLILMTDEIYEYMVYDDHEHVSLASLPGAYERTVTISGFSKTYNMTGWRLGYAVAPRPIAERMGLVNDLIYVCAPAPLQHGVVEAFSMPDTYFDDLRDAYAAKRRLLCDTLEALGFGIARPQGAYYVLADIRPLRDVRPGFEDDTTACQTLIDEAGVATVPGRSFFHRPEDGAAYLRFCYAKEFDVLERACAQLTEALAPARA